MTKIYQTTQAEFEQEYPLDFGHGVRGNWFGHQMELRYNEHAGMIVAHLHENMILCAGAIHFNGDDNILHEKWTLVSVDPITITPSIQGKDCDLHGYITEGKWVPV